MDISVDFLDKYNIAGPRYTSYPPANFFTEEYKSENYNEDLILSNKKTPENISLYIHVPFCPQICNFCGCFSEQIKDEAFIHRYIKALLKEIEKVSSLLDKNRLISQIHWGGGTPNAIPYKYISEVMDVFKQQFKFYNNCEIAIECNPAYLTLENIDELAQIGFNRISLGIQDFNNKVLDIVNRKPSAVPIEELITKIRSSGFKGLNIDLIYGLPSQTLESFIETIKKAVYLSPDRLVTFSYAHVPWIKNHQKDIREDELPAAHDKISMFIESLKLLKENGYLSIGMDHYAKPNDELAKALKNKTMHRNFQGYCTRETTGQVYGFGASSISQLYGAYAQNTKNTLKYIKEIESGVFAIERGYRLSANEIIIRTVITELMCNCYLDFSLISKQFNISIPELNNVLNFTEEKITEFIKDDLLIFNDNVINVNEKGRLVIRNIAMAFDPQLKTGEQVYSKTV